MKQFLKKAKLITLFILAIISFQGCDDDDTLLPKVIADFTYTLNESTATITFINTSEQASKYEWRSKTRQARPRGRGQNHC